MTEKLKTSILHENTLIPVSAIAFICGAVVWVTTIYAQGVSNAKAIEEIRVIQQNYISDIATMKSDISFIRGTLEKRNGHKDNM